MCQLRWRSLQRPSVFHIGMADFLTVTCHSQSSTSWGSKQAGCLGSKRSNAKGLGRQFVYWTLAVVLALGSLCAAAETATYRFDIPEQTADRSLTLLAQQAKVPLLFSFDEVHEVTTNAVVGEYTLELALERMLARTRLRGEINKHGVLTVVARPSDALVEGGTMKSSQDEIRPAVKRNGILGILAAVFSAGTGAQEPLAMDEEGVEQELEEIVVTGSRIRGAQSASPVVTITRQEIDLAGFATVEDIVENLPQNFGAGVSSDATNTDNKLQAVGGDISDFAGGVSVNLRGLGASSTLVLVDGRRMSPSGFDSDFTSISSIPVSVIERVEVMTDGASAIYGSDAIGGVINFILRDNYDGAETRLQYSSDASGDTSNTLFGQSFGGSWQNGNVLLTYEYYESEALAARDRTFTASNDLSPFGGTDRRQPGGSPANIIADGVYYAIPAGQDGTSLTAADFVGLENTRHLLNDRTFLDHMPAQERHSAFLYLTQTISAVELFAQARFSSEDSEARNNGTVLSFTVPGDDPATPEIEGNPFFVDPTGTGLTSVTVDNYWLIDEFGPQIRLGSIESSGAALGGRFGIYKNWHGELVANWSKEETKAESRNVVDRFALTAAVNETDPSLAFNPFGDGANTNPAILDSFICRDQCDPRFLGRLESENELWSTSFNVDGAAFDITGGAVRVAMGVDFRNESLSTISITGTRSKFSRDVTAVYGEVFFPLISGSNSRTGLQRLEFSLAARYEDYSDFGADTNPKLGLLWSPTQSLAFRGTVGTSYRAPTLRDLDETGNDTYFEYLPDFGVAPYNALYLNGRNADLQAEEATTWTAGFQWRPERVNGLSLDVTYFNIDYEDRIEVPSILGGLAATVDPRFASIITLDPTPEQIAAVVNDPLYDPDRLAAFGFGPYPAADIISEVLPVGAIVDNRTANLAQSVVTGVESQLSYAMETELGSFNFGLNGTYLFDFERRLLATDPLVDEVGTLGRPVDLRARGSASWSRGDWVVAGFVNYTDGYTDNVSSPARAVDSWTTVDLTVAYETTADAGVLGDTRLSLTIQNLFDEDPPFVDTIGGVAYDATNANPLGQFFSFQITKDW